MSDLSKPANLTGDTSRATKLPAQPKPLRFDKEREATETAYSVYRCAGPAGCGERVTKDALGQHASRQHDTYDYDVVNTIRT